MDICVNKHTGEKFNVLKFDGSLNSLDINMDQRMDMDVYRIASGSDYEGTGKGYLEFEYRDNEMFMSEDTILVQEGQYILRNIKGHYFVIPDVIFDDIYKIVEG